MRPHFIFWTLFIGYEVILGYSFSGKWGSMTDYITFYTLNIALFYGHSSLLVHALSMSRLKYIKLAIITVAEILLYLVIKYYVTELYVFTGLYKASMQEAIFPFVRDSIWRAIYFMGLGSVYGYIRVAGGARKEIEQLNLTVLQKQLRQQSLEKSLLLSENAFLKAQVNPHFFFNTLHMIHGAVVRHSEPAAEMLVEFSDVMRYAFREQEHDGLIALHEEIEHAENYLRINNKRFHSHTPLNLEIEGDPAGHRVIPMLLVTLIENIYKYGDLTDSRQPAKIQLEISTNNIKLSVSNRVAVRNHSYSSGIGMQNLKKRLEQFYSDNHTLEIEQSATEYCLSLHLFQL